jgi:hypothetical protein
VSSPNPCRLSLDLLILVNRYSEKLFEATIAASVACVFQCLSHTSRPALDQALSVVQKANALNLRTVQSVLYEQAKIFLDKFPRIENTSMGPQDGDVRSKNVSGEVEAFSSQLIDILFGPKTNEREPESTRMKRAALAEAFAKNAAASETRRLTTTLEEWLGKERSGPIRETIKRALLAIRMSG